jgi:hypothetical protein
MANDIEILRKAYDIENDPKSIKPACLRHWEYYAVGASRDDIRRLQGEGLIEVTTKTSTLTKYKLNEKGKSLVFATRM